MTVLFLLAAALCATTGVTPQNVPQATPATVSWPAEKALLISATPPVYPPIAAVAHVEGSVRVHFVIATDGTTKEVEYLSGPVLLMRAATDSIRTWRFKPTLVAGAAVEVSTIAPVNFFLPGDSADKHLAPFRKAVEKHPNDVKDHVALSRAALGVGETDEAVAEAQKAISLQPNDANSHFALADALADLDAAIQEYRQGIALGPKDADAYFNLSRLLDLKGDLDGAVAECRHGIELKPKDGARRNNFGILLMKKGDTDAAIVEFKEALRDGDDAPGTHFQYGRALEKQGDLDGALKEYQKALKVIPANQEYKDAADRVRSKIAGKIAPQRWRSSRSQTPLLQTLPVFGLAFDFSSPNTPLSQAFLLEEGCLLLYRCHSHAR